MPKKEINDLIEISQYYGNNPDFILSGGGNTSFKDDKYLYVKASGYVLAVIDETGFARMDRQKLAEIMQKKYPQQNQVRDQMVVADMLAANCDSEKKRPSVETLLHSILPQQYVVHTHPTLVNALTCARKGRYFVNKLFNDKYLWIKIVNPGITLAKTIQTALQKYRKKHNILPEAIFLQNHGIFVQAETTEQIRQIYDNIILTINNNLRYHPDFSPVKISERIKEHLSQIINNQEDFKNCHFRFYLDRALVRLLATKNDFKPVSSVFTPDHQVFAGIRPIFVEQIGKFGRIYSDFKKKYKFQPKIIAVKNTGIIACAETEKMAENALLLFRDSVKIALYSYNFGKYRFMPGWQINFIKNWELEKYRAKLNK